MKTALGRFFLVVLLFGASLWLVGMQQESLASPLTNVSGPITANTTWVPAGSPYVVTGDVTVNPGVTLTVQAGVDVRLDGPYSLSVRGALLAEGLPGQEVRFTSNQSAPAPGDWGVLDFRSDSNPSHLSFVVIEYGGHASKAGWYCAAGMVCANTSSLVVEHSTLR
jgi:hypothetical protein